MKRSIALLLVLTVALIVVATSVQAQLAFTPKTLTALATRVTSDTSSGLVIKAEPYVKDAIFYLEVDSCTTGYIKVWIQDSPDGTNWYTADTLTTVIAIGNSRKTISNIGPYIRAVNVITGGGRIRSKLIVAGKRTAG